MIYVETFEIALIYQCYFVPDIALHNYYSK